MITALYTGKQGEFSNVDFVEVKEGLKIKELYEKYQQDKTSDPSTLYNFHQWLIARGYAKSAYLKIEHFYIK